MTVITPGLDQRNARCLPARRGRGGRREADLSGQYDPACRLCDRIGGIAGHMFVDMPANRTGYLHKASILQDMSAVTAGVHEVKRSAFEEAADLTEKLSVAFNDVDLCLKVRKNGSLIVYDPYVQLYHMESKTRGAEDSEAKSDVFRKKLNTCAVSGSTSSGKVILTITRICL